MSNPAPTPSAPHTLSFEVAVTLEDQVALQMRCLSAPAMQAGRLRRTAIVALFAAACGPLALVGGLFIPWVGDRHGPSFGSVLHTLVHDEPGMLVTAALVMVGCTTAGMAIQRWLLRPRMRRLLRRVHKARPDVDATDPQLAYRAHVIVSHEGLESRTGIGTTVLRWGVLKGWEETAGRILILGDAMVGFCINARAADPEQVDRLRAILEARLGPRAR